VIILDGRRVIEATLADEDEIERIVLDDAEPSFFC